MDVSTDLLGFFSAVSPQQNIGLHLAIQLEQFTSSWWFQHIWKILVNLDQSPNRGDNTKYLKPPPRLCWKARFVSQNWGHLAIFRKDCRFLNSDLFWRWGLHPFHTYKIRPLTLVATIRNAKVVCLEFPWQIEKKVTENSKVVIFQG